MKSLLEFFKFIFFVYYDFYKYTFLLIKSDLKNIITFFNKYIFILLYYKIKIYLLKKKIKNIKKKKKIKWDIYKLVYCIVYFGDQGYNRIMDVIFIREIGDYKIYKKKKKIKKWYYKKKNKYMIYKKKIDYYKNKHQQIKIHSNPKDNSVIANFIYLWNITYFIAEDFKDHLQENKNRRAIYKFYWNIIYYYIKKKRQTRKKRVSI